MCVDVCAFRKKNKLYHLLLKKEGKSIYIHKEYINGWPIRANCLFPSARTGWIDLGWNFYSKTSNLI